MLQSLIKTPEEKSSRRDAIWVSGSINSRKCEQGRPLWINTTHRNAALTDTLQQMIQGKLRHSIVDTIPPTSDMHSTCECQNTPLLLLMLLLKTKIFISPISFYIIRNICWQRVLDLHISWALHCATFTSSHFHSLEHKPKRFSQSAAWSDDPEIIINKSGKGCILESITRWDLTQTMKENWPD